MEYLKIWYVCIPLLFRPLMNFLPVMQIFVKSSCYLGECQPGAWKCLWHLEKLRSLCLSSCKLVLLCFCTKCHEIIETLILAHPWFPISPWTQRKHCKNRKRRKSYNSRNVDLIQILLDMRQLYRCVYFYGFPASGNVCLLCKFCIPGWFDFR